MISPKSLHPVNQSTCRAPLSDFAMGLLYKADLRNDVTKDNMELFNYTNCAEAIREFIVPKEIRLE